MTRDELIHVLREHKPVLRERFGVTSLSLFGSFARDEGRDDSDVDVIATFDPLPDWKSYFEAVFYLEDLLGRQIDLATPDEVRKEIRPCVERDLVMV